MLRRLIVLSPLLWAFAAFAGEVTDPTGRVVTVPDHIAMCCPPARPAILLEAIAPDLMIGWPGPLSDDAKALLPDTANDPRIPRRDPTGRRHR